MPTSIYIVEDHEFMRRSLAQFIGGLPDLTVAGTAGSAKEALGQLGEAAVELVLIDTRLPDMNGIELVEELRKRWPRLRCLILSGHGETHYVERAMKAGAQGYVLKGNPNEIPEAIRRVLGGEVYISAQEANR